METIPLSLQRAVMVIQYTTVKSHSCLSSQRSLYISFHSKKSYLNCRKFLEN